MKKLTSSILVGLLLSTAGLKAQEVNYQSRRVQHKKVQVFDPRDFQPGFAVELKNLEAPVPGGDSYRSFMMRVKAESAKRFPRKQATSGKSSPMIGEAPDPIMLRSFPMLRYVRQADTLLPVYGGTPLDNTMAVSNDGILLGSVNSLLYGYDLKADTIFFKTNTNYISFDDFASELGTSFPFDPKLLYDPQEDRFVFVFLSGRTPNDSKIIVGFSSSNNPNDPWNIYEITGNPLKNNTWTDYPAIALTEGELFLTINLLRAGEPWQTGFAGSIIWQIDKSSGYSGSDTLDSRFWSDITHGGRLIRNLNPIQGGESLTGPNLYLLSNRNFDVQNDSIFLLEVTGTLDDPSTELKVKVGKSDVPYGAPPNGIQANSVPITDSTGFDTNDGRILGGFLHNDRIQFVCNTKNFETGRAAIYHGFVDQLNSDNISVTANIIGSDHLDLGYPNIAYTGKVDCDNEAIIGFDHTSDTVFSGVSAIHYSNTGTYSSIIRLKEGENYVERITGPYERWGDYFGIQRVYNEPGKVWTAGFYGHENNASNTWFAEILSPDSTLLALNTDTIYLSANSCEATINMNVSNGQEPYTYFWNGTPTTQTTFNVTCGEEYEFIARDFQNCVITASGKFNATKTDFDIYPNPTTDRVHLNFELQEDLEVAVRLYDVNGKLVHELLDQQMKKGLNLFSFSTEPLSGGVYFLTITSGNWEILNEKLVKQ